MLINFDPYETHIMRGISQNFSLTLNSGNVGSSSMEKLQNNF